MSPPSSSRTHLLRSRTQAFCHALITPPPPSKLLTDFFTPANPTIHEHGPSFATARLPFLGAPFTGYSSCLEYFSLLNDTLSMELKEDAFPGAEGFVVDCDASGDGGEGEGALKGVVHVVGKGRFTSKKTGKGWDEKFAYRFSGFDDEGRFEKWEVWADPLSAWVAVGE